jgi:nicotinamidase-related amidase
MSEIFIPNPERKRALLVIDMQAGFLRSGTKWIIPNVQEVIKTGGYSLFVEAVFHADKGSLWERQVGWTFPFEPTVSAIKEALPPGTTVITKTTKSAFKGDRDLLTLLRTEKIEEVHIVGLDANDCVFATAQESFDLGFYTYVLEECVESSEGKEYREHALEILRELKMTNHSVL